MALKFGKPNPLNYFGMRRVSFLPPYFASTHIDKYTPTLVKELDKWIKANLNGRYYIGQDIALDSNKSFMFTTKIGFENEKELSFFTIACPVLQTR